METKKSVWCIVENSNIIGWAEEREKAIALINELASDGTELPNIYRLIECSGIEKITADQITE